MDLYNTVTRVVEGFLILVAVAIVVNGVVGSLVNVNTEVDEAQKVEYRSLIVLENVLSLQPSEENLDYRYDSRRAVLPIEYFDSGQIKKEKEGSGKETSSKPRDVMIVLDLSKSLRGSDRIAMMEGSLDIASALRDNDRGGVILFARDPNLLQGLTLDKGQLRRSIGKLGETHNPELDGLIESDESTDIYSGLEMAQNKLSGDRGEEDIIILMSDGVQTDLEEGDPVEMADKIKSSSDTKIFTIAYGFEAEEGSLDEIASKGSYYKSGEGADALKSTFGDVAKDLDKKKEKKDTGKESIENDPLCYRKKQGHCYIDEVAGLDGENYGFYVRPLEPVEENAEDPRTLGCKEPRGKPETTVSSPVTLIRKGRDNPRLPARIYVYKIEGPAPGGNSTTCPSGSGSGPPGSEDGSSDGSGSDGSDSGSTSSGWADKADMPIEVTGNGGAVINGKLYSFGGTKDSQDVDGDPVTDEVFVYDPEADSWSQTDNNLPIRMKSMASVGVGDRAYIFAGAEPGAPWQGGELLNGIYRYEPGKGFTRVGTHPGGSYGAAAVYDEETGLVYVAGGATGKTSNSRRIFTFDPETESVEDPNWASLPVGVRWPAAGILEKGGKKYLHVMGGVTYAPGSAQATRLNSRYSLDTGKQGSMKPLPRPAGKLPRGNPVIDNRFYIPMGLSWPHGQEPDMSSYKEATWMYNPEDDSWDTGLPKINQYRARDVGATGVIDGTLYIAGGHQKLYDGDGDHDTKRYTDAFTP